MLDVLATGAKLFFIPGSTSFLLVGLTIGLLLMAGPRAFRQIAIAEMAILTALYWTLSMPVVADALATRFHHNAGPADASDVRGCDAIVVLGAGVSSIVSNGQTLNLPDPQTAFNAFEGARVYRLLGSAVPVVASGGVVYEHQQIEPESLMILELLQLAGVPRERIILESASRTTREQAVNVSALTKQRGWRRIALVAPPAQMPRARQSFASQGIRSVQPVEAPFQSEPSDIEHPSPWVPSLEGLWVSQRALYDYVGWAYYSFRGWLA